MQIKQYISTFIWCSVALIIGLQNHFGIFAVLLFFVFLFSLFKVIKHVFFKNSNKNQELIRLSLWGACLVIVVTKHIIIHSQARDIADSISDQVLLYYSKHGSYPSSLEGLSINKKDLDKIDFFYKNDKSGVYLVYLVTWTIKDFYQFNFETKNWDYLSS